MSSIGYFFKESIQGFARNLSTTLGSIITIFLSLMIIGIFLVGAVMADRLLSSIEDEVSITAYVADDAEQADIDALMADLGALDGVKTVSFTTKDQARENFRETISDPEILDLLGDDNPLPASVDIELDEAQMVESVADYIVADETFRKICDKPEDPSDSVKYGSDTTKRLLIVINYVRFVGLILIALLIFIAMIFISNTIRLAILARRKEIAIMRLVGASNGFIRGPFLMEGALHAIIGSLLAVGVIQLLRMYAVPQLQNALMFLNFSIADNIYLLIYAALIVAGLLIGLIGSAFAMRRYLKV